MVAVPEHGANAYTCTVPAAAANGPVTLLKYRIVNNVRLPVVARSRWEIQPTSTTITVQLSTDEKLQQPIEDLAVLAPVSGNVTGMDAQPQALWSAKQQKALWKLPSLSPAQPSIQISGRFATQQQASQQPIAINFKIMGQLASSLHVDSLPSLFSTARMGRVLMRCTAGQYLA